MLRFYDCLTEEDIKIIHNASLEVVENTGIELDHAGALQELKDKGVRVDFDKKRVYFSAEQVERLIAMVPNSFHCGSRNNAHDFTVCSGGPFSTRGGGGITQIFDPIQKTARTLLKEDCVDFARVFDALPNIDVIGTPTPTGFPVNTYDIHTMATMLQYTQKHMCPLTVDSKNLAYQLKIVEAIAGSKEALRQSPLISGIVCIIDPLFMPGDEIERLKLYAEYNLPVRVPLVPVTGATAPFTLGGTLVEINAEFLISTAIIQFFAPGLPCFYYLLPKIMDMKTAGMVGGSSPENMIVCSAVAQLARYYNIPSSLSAVTASCCQSHQIMHQYAQSINGMAMAGATDINTLGHVSGSSQISLVLAVIGDEAIGIARRYMNGLDLSRDALAIEAIDRVGPKGHFLADPHTMQFLRKEERYETEIFQWDDYQAWERKGKTNIVERANERYESILETHEVPPMEPALLREIESLVAAADKELG